MFAITNKNELWKLQPGWLAGYTQDRDLMRRIKRYKNWRVMGEYFKNGRLIGLQYKIPAKQRRSAERMFNCKVAKN